LINSAKEEIQMVFSTANTISNQKRAAGNPSLLKPISDKLENGRFESYFLLLKAILI
jgi:hypothetical protein